MITNYKGRKSGPQWTKFHKMLIEKDPHAIEMVCVVMEHQYNSTKSPYVWSMRRYIVRNFAARMRREHGMRLVAIVRKKR